MSRAPTVYVAISGTIGRETTKAIQLYYYDTQLQKEIPVWLPISQISSIVRAAAGDPEAKSVLMVAEWLVDKNDMHFIPSHLKHPAPQKKAPVYDLYVGKNSSIKPTGKNEDDEIPF